MDSTSVFKNMFKSRIIVDFNDHKLKNAINVFKMELCCVMNEELWFIHEL